jgi:branched-subunit amino acid aminotransferase/4-amino-4-deoxychorismate lyase
LREFYLVNGKPASAVTAGVSIKDRGLLYGYSLFETMPVKNGKPVLLFHHLERMDRSASELGIRLPGGRAALAALCCDAVGRSGVIEGVLRLTVTAGSGVKEDGCSVISVREAIPYRKDQYEKGVSLMTLHFPRNERSPLVKHKTANYLENLLGRLEARRRGYDEGVFLNTSGRVAEGTVSNIFMVRNGELLTPPVEAGLLPGIVRRLVIEGAATAGLVCKEVNFTRLELQRAEECFITNSLMGIMPVTRLDDLPVGNGKPGPVTLKIAGIYLAAAFKSQGC